MAYKRKTRKTGPNSRSSTTSNTNGASTYSNSNTSNGVTYTQTSKNGKYYTTQTIRRADGSVERKRVQSSTSKPTSGSGGLVLLIILGVLALFGVVVG
jgi:cobalamin biosynthesis Mg chelatase CobN